MENIIEKIKNNEVKLLDLIKEKKAYFKHYQSEYLNYETEDGLKFQIPMKDTDEGIFKNEHNAIELMRWIRKQFDFIKNNHE